MTPNILDQIFITIFTTWNRERKEALILIIDWKDDIYEAEGITDSGIVAFYYHCLVQNVEQGRSKFFITGPAKINP